MKPLHPIDAFGIAKVTLSSIRVDRLEERVVPKVAFPHKHDFYQLILITKGSGFHQVDFQQYDVSVRQLYLLKPGQIHTWSMKKSIRGFVVEFNRHSLTTLGEPDLIRHLDLTDDVMMVQKTSDFEELVSLCQIMQNESSRSGELQDVGLKGLLTGFLALIIRQLGELKSTKKKSDALLDRFRTLVDEHFRREHRVEFYAQKLGVTSKALTMQLSRLLNKSPREVIQDRFLMEAKRYLAYSDLSVAEIGYAIGFDDANYFTRFFRSHAKMTPAQFRKKYSSG